jgi:hypothetical protein
MHYFTLHGLRFGSIWPVCCPHEVGKFCGQAGQNLLRDMQDGQFPRFAQKLRMGGAGEENISLNFCLSKQP